MPTFPHENLHFGCSFFRSDVISSTALNSPLAYKLAPLADQYAQDAGISHTDGQPGLHVKDTSVLCRDAPCHDPC